MITLPVRDDIRAFAAAVRTHLDDLPAEDLDDLLDGLEADVSDQAAEAGADFTLPDAATYAAELRAAAGLPERTAAPAEPPLSARIARRWNQSLAQVRSNPVGGWLVELAASLRPVWWVLRGVVLFLVVVIAVPFPRRVGVDLIDRTLAATTPLGFVLLAALVFLSIQWGRGRWAAHRWTRVLRRIVNVVTAVLAPFLLIGLLASAHAAIVSPASASNYVSYTPGLTLDGQRVRNVYAFDAKGEQIPLVQLYTQDGTPLTTVGNEIGNQSEDPYFAGGGGPVPVPVTVAGGGSLWNVFPLREIPPGAWGQDHATAAAPAFPFTRVQPLPTPDAATTAPDVGTPPPTPSDASPTPAPTPSPAP